MTLSADARLLAVQLGYDPDDPDLLARLVEDQAADVEHVARVQQLYPLATSLLWQSGAAAIDQRRAVASLLRTRLIGILTGGNRSGKTASMLDVSVAKMLGGDHPAVRAWCEQNGLGDIIEPGPGSIFLVAQKSGDSIRIHRGEIDRRIGPRGKTWYNRNGKGEAHVLIEVPGYSRRAECWFKSIDQGREAFQGDSLRFVGIDEEPLGEEGMAILDECRMRVADQQGQIFISCSPLSGYTWMFERYFQGAPQDDAVTHALDTLDNPHIPREFFERLYATMSEDAVAQRRFGQFRSRTGAVYPLWAPGDGDRWGPGHLCDPFEIPTDWPRFRSADWGLDDPTCVLWGALGDDNTLYVYREYYQPDGESYEWHADNCALLEGLAWTCQHEEPCPEGTSRVACGHRDGEWDRVETTEPIDGGWCDHNIKARAAFVRAGMPMTLVPKTGEDGASNMKGGIDLVRNRMRLYGDNRPRLKIFRALPSTPTIELRPDLVQHRYGCPNLIRELPQLSWDPNRKDEVPKKGNDHAPDTLRYEVVGIEALRALF